MTHNADTLVPIEDVQSTLFDTENDQTFSLVSGGVSMPVRLVICRENPEAAGPDSVRTPFALIFQAELDEQHPMQKTIEFQGGIHGLKVGVIDGLLIHRTLRPVDKPEGAYYQVIFN